VQAVRRSGAVFGFRGARGVARQAGEPVRPLHAVWASDLTLRRCTCCGHKAGSQAALIKHIETKHARATEVGLQCSACNR